MANESSFGRGIGAGLPSGGEAPSPPARTQGGPRGSRAPAGAPLLPLLATTVAILSGCATTSEMEPGIPGGGCPLPPGATSSVEGAGSDAPEIPWIVPVDPEDRKTLAAWCRVVGPPVVRLDPDALFLDAPGSREGEAGAEDPPIQVSVVTWNTWIGGGDIDAFLADRMGVRCSEAGPSLTDAFSPFVLLLQEVHRRSPLVPDVDRDAPVPWLIDPGREPHMEPGIVEVARRCGLALAYIPSARNGWERSGELSEDKGNAILSSLPLHHVTAIELPFEAGRKVTVAAAVDLPAPGGPIRLDLASVHFDVASTLFRTLVTGNQTRHRQAKGFLAGMEMGGFVGRGAVVGGDFNTWSQWDGSLKILAGALPDSPPVSGEGTRGPFPTDHLFFREDPEGRVGLVEDSYEMVPESYGSDHKARMFRLRIGGGPPPEDRPSPPMATAPPPGGGQAPETAPGVRDREYSLHNRRHE